MLKTVDECNKIISEKLEKELNRTPTEEEIEERYKQVQKMMAYSLQTPERYKKAKSSDIPTDILSYLPFDGEKQGVYLWGGVGTGKTHILYSVQRLFMERLTLFEIANMSSLLAEIRSSFDTKSSQDILDSLYSAYDDLGAEKESDWVGEQTYRLVNHFYENKKRFFFTSNLPLGELAKRFGVQGDRIASRIAEMAHVVELKGPDRRV